MTKAGERIAALREEVSRVRGFPLYQPELGDLVGVTRQQVSHWELGRREVNSKELAVLADVFSRMLGRPISVDYLLGREERSFATQKDTETAPRMYLVGQTQKVDVFESIPTAEPPKKVGEEEVAVTDLQECSGPVFFLVISDDSMAGAGIHKGHRVLIDTKAPVADGDIVLVAVAGEEFASLRQIYREGDGVLVVANGLGQRPSVHKPSDVRIVGKMVFGRYYPGQRQG